MGTTDTIELVAAERLDDDAVAALAALRSEVDSERTAGDPPISAAQLAVDSRHLPSWRRDTYALAWDGQGQLLGYAMLELEDRADNRHLAWVEAGVAARARRRGLGAALLSAVLPIALEDDRTDVMAGAVEGTPGASFLAGRGLTVGLREHRNRVRTRDISRPLLERWVADAATAAAGYSLVRVDGSFPDELLEPYARLHPVMNDAPLEDLVMEDVQLSTDDLRSAQLAAARGGTTIWTVVARHDATGELAGLTELRIAAHDRWLAAQGDTGVAAAHRGHGLGRWLKAANALRLLDEVPEVSAIETWNAGTNAHMLAINHAMGFRPESVHELRQGATEAFLHRLGVHP